MFSRRYAWSAILMLTACSAVSKSPAAEPKSNAPQIHVVSGADNFPVAFEVVDLPPGHIKKLAIRTSDDEFSSLFAVYVVDESTPANPPPIVGDYVLDGDVLRFTPRFPLRRGLRYRAALQLDVERGPPSSADARKASTATTLSRDITLPDAPAAEPTELIQIYPTADALPENLLRIYFHFSAPMSRGDVYQYMRLLDESGRPIEFPFLELGEELWDRQARRLTLLLDPGRVKTGLKSREEAGPVLEAGHRYTLHVDRHWRDAAGNPLKVDFKKTFRAAPAATSGLDTATWKIGPPASGTREPLVVRFPQGLDHALLQHTLTVRGPDRRSVQGDVTIGDAERRWEFRPDLPWPAGAYHLVVNTILEDQCGNRIGRPFEVDRWVPIEEQTYPEIVEIPFAVAGVDRHIKNDVDR